MLAIYKKEMQGYFTSMIAYLFLAAFVVLVGIYFVYYCVGYSLTDFAGYVLPSTCTWLGLLVPIITMRLWSEERKQKTDQLLLTSPISVVKIVIGKYLAVLSLFVIALAIIMLYPFMLHFYGDVEWTTIALGMFGYFLVGAALIAVGFFISSLTENQIVSAVVTAVLIFASFFLNNISNNLPGRARYSIIFYACVVVAVMVLFYVSTKKVLPSVVSGIIGAGAIALVYFIKPSMYDDGLSKVIDWFSMMERYTNSFINGLLDVSAVVYYLSFAGVFLFLTVHMIEKKRWN